MSQGRKLSKEEREDKKFWLSISDISRDSKPSTIYLLKANGFSNANCYRAVKSGLVTTSDLIESFQNFIKDLKPENPVDLAHLKALKLLNVDRTDYKLSLAEKADLIGTVDSIIARKCEGNPASSSASSPRSSQAQSQATSSFSIPNLQAFVNKQLKSLFAEYGRNIEDFPIHEYIIDKFPYKITNLCPLCQEKVTWNISLDTKKNGKSYITARRYMFEQHLKNKHVEN